MTDPEYVDLWMLQSPAAATLAAEAARFDDLQTVLRCCERVLPELGRAEAGSADADLLVESLWTVALTSYARCFSQDAPGECLTEADVVTALPDNEAVRDWHRALMRLRRHYASVSTNPREAFSVSVARDDAGAAAGIAITSAAQPRLDEVTVRTAGTIAYALSSLVDKRVEKLQEELFAEVGALDPRGLDALEKWRAERPTAAASPA